MKSALSGRSIKGLWIPAVLLGTTLPACAEATPPEPLTLEIVGGDEQEAQTSTTLSDLLSIEVTGLDGAPRQGVRVTWSSSPGGGSVVPEADFTDAEGSAKASWTLGPDVGGQIVTASVRGTDTVFQAWATPPPPADWLEVLEIQPEAVVQEGVLLAEVRIWSSWPGTIRLHTPESCLVSIGYPALYSSTGELVSHWSSGCWAVPTDHLIPPGDTLSREAEMGIADVEPGEFTLRFRFDVGIINGTAAAIPDIEIPVSIGG